MAPEGLREDVQMGQVFLTGMSRHLSLPQCPSWHLDGVLTGAGTVLVEYAKLKAYISGYKGMGTWWARPWTRGQAGNERYIVHTEDV